MVRDEREPENDHSKSDAPMATDGVGMPTMAMTNAINSTGLMTVSQTTT
jgi:hypothetical protein